MTHATDRLEPAYDAVVVGGRCAGAATALLLAQQGLDVLVVEQGMRGADTLSTLALMRAGVLQLSKWGLLDAIKAAGTPRIETTTFHYGGEPLEIRIKPRGEVDALYAPRRTLLDPLLAEAAAASGAQVAYRTRVRQVRRDDRGRVRGVVVESGGAARSIAASIVIGADGADSTVAELVAAKPYRTGAHSSAVIYTLVRGLDVRGYHWYYGPGGSVGAIPTNHGDTLVFVAEARTRFIDTVRVDLAFSFQKIVREISPELAERIAAAPVGAYHGFAGRPGYIRPAWGRGWALVGDAGYFKDPITAHGITDALRDAELLARAVLRGTDDALAAYQTIRDELSVRLFDLSDRIASFDWDLPQVQLWHRSLSEEMAREVSYLADLRVSSHSFAASATGASG
jgi:2-polyprenyl-6-methoxyphenol hydroxylase-like FAD-dependent oxidoreductase